VKAFALQLEELWDTQYNDFKNFFYSFAGDTPLQKLPDELNPNGNIYLKREDLEPTGSIKVRTASGIHYLRKNKLLGKNQISLASSGNFAKDLPYVIKKSGMYAKIKNFISEKTVEENPELISGIEGEIVPIKDEDYCPASRRKRGKAIAYAKAEEKFFDAVSYNQYEDVGNVFGNLTLGEEIHKQIDSDDIVLVIALGTGGSALGSYYGYYFASNRKLEFIGLIPQEEHHQLGLRSLLEHGDSEFYKEIKSFAERMIEINDKDAFERMEILWEYRIPAGLSTGTNFAGAMEINTDKDIVTLMPDSIRKNNYRTFLKKHFEGVTGRRFNEDLYNSLQ